MSHRVELPVYTDRWMMGDRYGEVVKTTKQRRNFPVGAAVSADAKGTYILIAHVQLDKSRKMVKVLDDDCRTIS